MFALQALRIKVGDCENREEDGERRGEREKKQMNACKVKTPLSRQIAATARVTSKKKKEQAVKGTNSSQPMY